MCGQQLPLFGGQGVSPTLAESLEPFRRHMEQKGFAENTVKSFLGDLRIFMGYLGPKTRVGEIATADLNRFLNYPPARARQTVHAEVVCAPSHDPEGFLQMAG